MNKWRSEHFSSHQFNTITIYQPWFFHLFYLRVTNHVLLVQVLSAPYLQTMTAATQVNTLIPGSLSQSDHTAITIIHTRIWAITLDIIQEELEQYNLRNRGLCLVPMEYTAGVAQSNGADIWAPVKTPPSPAFGVKSQSPFRWLIQTLPNLPRSLS